MTKLTLLTDPLPVGRYYWMERAKQMGRVVRNLSKSLPVHMRSNVYRGHPAVTRSIVEGLQKIGVPHVYNPQSLSDVTETVVVLSNVSALRQAIGWKREGRIRRLIAGTNIVAWPSDFPEIYAPEVDLCIVPSDWVSKIYVDSCPALGGRCLSLSAGVDTSYWSPHAVDRKRTEILIYVKWPIGDKVEVIDSIVQLLESRNCRVTMIECGEGKYYLKEDYIELLQKAMLMVGFSASESQGIAWDEAWSTDVPTFILRNNLRTILDRTVAVSSAPYLTEHTGYFFDDLGSFDELFSKWEAGLHTFHPRQWVLENMSDEICAWKLCELAGVETGKARPKSF